MSEIKNVETNDMLEIKNEMLEIKNVETNEMLEIKNEMLEIKNVETNNMLEIKNEMLEIKNVEKNDMLEIKNVEKNDKDGKLILKWRNDPVTRNMFIDKKKKTWDKFKIVFYDKYFDHYIKPVFCLFNKKKIAFIGVMEENNNYDFNISINIDPSFRGKGLSNQIINKFIGHIKLYYKSVNNLYAYIKEENLKSIKCFLKSGFKYVGKKKEDNFMLNIYELNINYNIMEINNSLMEK